MAAQLFFGEDQFAIEFHFKDAAGGGDEGERLKLEFKFFEQLGRQTGGAVSVVSNCAVGEGEDGHGGLLSDEKERKLKLKISNSKL